MPAFLPGWSWDQVEEIGGARRFALVRGPAQADSAGRQRGALLRARQGPLHGFEQHGGRPRA